jgi:hypothetical protein
MADYDWTADPVVQPGGQAPAAPGYDYQADPVVPPSNRPPGAINAAGDTVDPVTGRLRIRVTPRNQPDPNLLPKVEGEDYQPAGPPQEPMGALPALGVGAVQGATVNFGDEALGALAAGTAGLPPGGEAVTRAVAQAMPTLGLPLQAGAGLARMIYENLAGQTSGEQPKGPATSAYEQARDRWRATVERAQTQRPYSYGGGNVFGSVMLPVGVAAAPVRAALAAGGVIREGLRRLGTRMVRGATTGAAVGGVSGVGEGEDLTDRAVKGATGTVAGGVIGAVAPVATDVVAIPARAAWRTIANASRGLRSPVAESERRIAGAVEGAQEREAVRRAAGAEPNTLTPQEFAEAQARGQPVAVIDIAGRGGKRMAKSVRNTPGAEEGTEALEGLVEGRFRSQAERTARFIDGLTSGRNVTTFDRLMERARSANAPAYRRAYNEADALVRQSRDAFWTPELRRLSSSPDINEAMAGVGRKEGNRTIIEGFQSPRRNPFVQRPDSPRMGIREFDTGSTRVPDLHVWDSVQRVLRGKQGEAVRAGNSERARELTLLRERLNTELDRIVPAFRDARGTAFHGFRAEDAYEAGMNYVTRIANPRESEALSRTIARMGQTDRLLFMHGFATSLIGRVREARDGVDVVNRIYESPAARERVVEALGAQRAREMEAFLRVETVMNQSRRAVTGNSSTAEQLLASGAAGSLAYGAATGNWDITTLMAGAGAAGGRRIAQRSGAQMADRIGEMLASNNPNVYRAGIALLSRSDDALNNLRRGMAALGSKAAPPQITHEMTDQRANQPSQ